MMPSFFIQLSTLFLLCVPCGAIVYVLIYSKCINCLLRVPVYPEVTVSFLFIAMQCILKMTLRLII